MHRTRTPRSHQVKVFFPGTHNQNQNICAEQSILMNSNQFLIGVAIALAIALFVVSNRAVQLMDMNKRVLSLAQEQQAEIEVRKNKEGKAIAEKVAAEVRLQEFKAVLPNQVEAIEKAFDIKIKNLENFIAVKFSAQGSGSSTINNYYQKGDSTHALKELVFNDRFLSFKAQLDQQNIPSTYTYMDSLTVIGFWKRKWFGGRQTHYVDAMFQNPNNVSTGLRNIKIDSFKDKRFVLGPYVGIDIQGKPSVGFALHYDLIRLW